MLRSRIVMIFSILFAIISLARVLYLQIVQGPRLRRLSTILHLEERAIEPIRGNVTDCNGNYLATTLPLYRLAIDPSILDVADFESKIRALSKRLDVLFQNAGSTKNFLSRGLEARRKGRKYFLISKEHINHRQRQMVVTWPFFDKKSDGGIVEKTTVRFKPFKNLASRSIGYVNESGVGVGVEGTYNSYLSGVPGRAVYKKISGGNWKILHNGLLKRPQHGLDVETTIDINLQDSVHASLMAVLQESKAQNACAIVMEVHTGEIKAMVNLSLLKDGSYDEHYNYAIGSHGVREPGSIFKMISMMAVLEETGLSLDHRVDTGNGRMKFYDRTMTETNPKGYGVLTLKEVFEKSSNVGISVLVQEFFGKKPQRFIDFLKKLHLDRPTGINLLGEGKPYVPSTKDKYWSGVSLPWMSIGYGVKFSPLQMLVVYNAVANNGTMLQPIFVKSIKQANRTGKGFPPVVIIKKICSDATLAKLKSMLEGVVERGTAKQFNQSFYKIAGKSGTANVLVAGKYTSDTYISFVGYFPAERPRYSCIVMMDCPKSKSWHFGGKLASVVKNIADKLASQDLSANRRALKFRHPLSLDPHLHGEEMD